VIAFWVLLSNHPFKKWIPSKLVIGAFATKLKHQPDFYDLILLLCSRYFFKNIPGFRGVISIRHSRKSWNPVDFEPERRLLNCVAIFKTSHGSFFVIPGLTRNPVYLQSIQLLDIYSNCSTASFAGVTVFL
jgi:hypothetical protein